MVEYILNLDDVFQSLSDGTRRDILSRVYKCDHTISELAVHYKMSFAAAAKHIAVLEKARLVFKRKVGKKQIVSANPKAIEFATVHLEKYEMLWRDRFDRLDNLLTTKEE